MRELEGGWHEGVASQPQLASGAVWRGSSKGSRCISQDTTPDHIAMHYM